MENIPLKSWCCAQLVRCHVYEPPVWKQDGWCKGLPERVRFPLLALSFSCFISLPAARQGRDLFVPFLLLFSLLLLFHPPKRHISSELQDDLNEEQIVPWPVSILLPARDIRQEGLELGK